MNEIPPWLLEALHDLGVEEVPGEGHSPEVLAYLETCDNLSDVYRGQDETPWCSAAMNGWMDRSGVEGTRNALARSWLSWGTEVEPTPGAVCVIRRRRKGPDVETGSRRGYHVGIYLNHSRRTNVVLLSGNAQDRVGIDAYARGHWEVKGYRWPVQ